MQLISFYLPQFHEIPENNDSWGKGFTEWTNVRASKPLFWGHKQPRVPQDNNYYDLLNPQTLIWQTKLANQYGIDCFCFYHYWFNGRMVLEKPVEILSNMPELHINYCFAWANEPWTKTWHGAGGEKEILIPQSYGREEEWAKHYEYFIKYFKDVRYLKKNNCPVLLIYKLQNIPYYNDMIKYWKMRAKDDGFDGLFLLCMKTSKNHIYSSKWIDGTVDFEPNNTKASMIQDTSQEKYINTQRKSFSNYRKIKHIDYVSINKEMLLNSHKKNEFRTVFVDYDDTPRRKEKGIITIRNSVKRFAFYLKQNIDISKQESNAFLFINAWNEWGEGNYLEPDKTNGYAYLKAVKKTKMSRGTK